MNLTWYIIRLNWVIKVVIIINVISENLILRIEPILSEPKIKEQIWVWIILVNKIIRAEIITDCLIVFHSQNISIEIFTYSNCWVGDVRTLPVQYVKLITSTAIYCAEHVLYLYSKFILRTPGNYPHPFPFREWNLNYILLVSKMIDCQHIVAVKSKL